MGEGQSGSSNKVILIGLGLLAGIGIGAGAYYTQFGATSRVQPQPRNAVGLLRLTVAKDVGQTIQEGDLEVVWVSQDIAEAMGGVIMQDCKGFVVGRPVQERVPQGQWLMWRHVAEEEPSPLRPSKGRVAMPVRIDVGGPLLKPGERVNLVAMITMKGKPPRYYRVIQGVKVLGVAGGSPEPAARPADAKEPGDILLEIDKDVALELSNVLSHAKAVNVEVLPPLSRPGEDVPGKINPELRELAQAAASRPARAGGMPGEEQE